jgi:hypothetical protein
VAIGLLVLGLVTGLLLQISRRSAPAGKSIIWYSSAALLPAIICSGVGALPFGQILGLAFEDVGVLFGLWAAGPIGLLAGFFWAWRHPGVQRPIFNSAITWWIVGILIFVLLFLGIWLGGEIMDTGQPPPKQVIPAPPKSQALQFPTQEGLAHLTGFASAHPCPKKPPSQ